MSVSQDQKSSNPKDAIGSTKLPLHLVPDTLEIYASPAFAEGASKYGAFNWRVAGVRASIYIDAHDRHMKKYWNGEWADPKTRVPHLSSAIACLAIILDAKTCGKLNDDRPPKADVSALVETMEGVAQHVAKINADFRPHHHTQADVCDEKADRVRAELDFERMNAASMMEIPTAEAAHG